MSSRIVLTGLMITALIGTTCFSQTSTFADSSNDLDTLLRKTLASNDVHAIEKPKTDPDKVELGRMLFWDKILSGNKNIACVTCHLMEAATGDGLPLSIGQGGEGVMTTRKPPLDNQNNPVLVPRNATEIFNRAEFITLFWDGRVMTRRGGQFIAPVAGSPSREGLNLWTPAAFELPKKLDNALAAQAMFPPTSDTEMRGNVHENSLGALKRWEWTEIWNGLMERLLAIDEYVQLFKKAYPNTPKEELTFGDAANAIAEFEIEAFTLTDAPFDQYLRGDNQALTLNEKKGALIFYGKGLCGRCHSGKLMTNEIFHNRAVPQIGPGKGIHIPAGGIDGTWDKGRAGVTGFAEYAYAFRTPPLRNVEKTGPWMHDGAFSTLEATVRHELDPIESAKNYNPADHLQELYAETFRQDQMSHITISAITKPEDIERVSLSDEEIKDLVAFLKSLTSPSLDGLVKLNPSRVPSGLPLKD